MKRLSYLLILTLLLAQVDDAWAVANVLPSSPLPDDSQEYLPSQQPTQREESTPRQYPLFTDSKQQTANSSFVKRCVPGKWNLVATFAPPPLYKFMSLQI
jgi:hypothetical protein